MILRELSPQQRKRSFKKKPKTGLKPYERVIFTTKKLCEIWDPIYIVFNTGRTAIVERVGILGEKRVPTGSEGVPQELAQGFSSRIKIKINEDTNYRVYYMGI